MDDLISRLAAIDALHKKRIETMEKGQEVNHIWECLDVIAQVPSAQQWIPCSEKPPHTNGVYNVTRKISDGFECRNISDACYYDGANTWHDDTRVNHERMYLTDVIAWMPLPEPYKAESEDKE